MSTIEEKVKTLRLKLDTNTLAISRIHDLIKEDKEVRIDLGGVVILVQAKAIKDALNVKLAEITKSNEKLIAKRVAIIGILNDE